MVASFQGPASSKATSGQRFEEPSPTMTSLGIIKRFFTTADKSPYDGITWVKRTALLLGRDEATGKEKIVFQQDDVEVPDFWSQRAVNIFAKHYFRGPLNTPERETSLKQVAERVARTISEAGVTQGLLKEEEAVILYDELRYIIVHQIAAFNSPVWYNVGVEPQPQSSACFILNVEDSLVGEDDSILSVIQKEGRIFKYGSGSGLNLSKVREALAPLSRGGQASGVLSWMRTWDANAGSIKSGGRTRRAACMRILNVDHPDIRPFINLKAHEEKKMAVLIAAGYDGSLGGEAEQSVTGQNANNSVRATDRFMELATDPSKRDSPWILFSRSGRPEFNKQDNAAEIFELVNQRAWECADPGMQFHDTINRMHTCKEDGEIDGSNPCSEYMFLNDTACNLASTNLCMMSRSGQFELPDSTTFRHVIDIVFTSQEILVGFSGYPTEEIANRSRIYRTIGLGYGNLGALLMANGIGYDSDYGRRLAGALASFMTARAYEVSACIAQVVGPCEAFERNRSHFAQVMRAHRASNSELQRAPIWPNAPVLRNGHSYKADTYISMLTEAAGESWSNVVEACERGAGLRNAQATVLAPTGTISFMMDFDTTSGEPSPGLVQYKQMVDGSEEKMAFRPLARAFKALGMDDAQVAKAVEHVGLHESVFGLELPKRDEVYGNPFLCAFKSRDGREEVLSPRAHVLMVAAIQPFISGAISKTCNMPNESTVQDVADLHTLAWKTGAKAIAIYRDGSKNLQVIDTKKKSKEASVPVLRWGERDKLGADVVTKRHKFSISGVSGFIHVGEDAEGHPKELFIGIAKTGSVLRGLLDAFGMSTSYNLQLGMPLDEIVDKYRYQEFAPNGFTGNPKIPSCTSILDYVAKYLGSTYLGHDYSRPSGEAKVEIHTEAATTPTFRKVAHDGLLCHACGGMMTRNGACMVCTKCAATSGCS